MSIKVVTNFGELMRLARLLGDAKLSGDIERIKEAERNLKSYEELCKKSEMQIGLIGDIS